MQIKTLAETKRNETKRNETKRNEIKKCPSAPNVAPLTYLRIPKSNILHTFTSISHLFSVPYVCLFDTFHFPHLLLKDMLYCEAAKSLTLIPYFRILVPSLHVLHYTTLHITYYTLQQFSMISALQRHLSQYLNMIQHCLQIWSYSMQRTNCSEMNYLCFYRLPFNGKMVQPSLTWPSATWNNYKHQQPNFLGKQS